MRIWLEDNHRDKNIMLTVYADNQNNNCDADAYYDNIYNSTRFLLSSTTNQYHK